MVSAAAALRGGLEEVFISSKPCLDDYDQFGPMGLGDGKAYFKVENRLLPHLATNSANFDQAN